MSLFTVRAKENEPARRDGFPRKPLASDSTRREIAAMEPTTYNPLLRPLSEVPTLAQWRQASSNARFTFMDRRGSPEIRAVDNRVAEYSKLAAVPNIPVMDLWHKAMDLLESVEVYLASPRGHKQKRVDAVTLLKLQTKATLARLRWQKYKEVTGGYQHGMKPMVPHVWTEMHSPGHARVGHGDNVLDPNPWLNGDPDAKEKYLFEYLRRVRAETPNPDNVVYIEDSDKWKYQVVFSEYGLAYERQSAKGGQILQSSRPITTKGWDNLSTLPYAVDEDGIFYTETSNHLGGTLNHCSFLGGKPVMCAGNIGITNGVIGYIDNGSGHYRPTVQNLLKCLKALKEQSSGLSFDAIIVRNHASQDPMSAYLAGKFLAMRGRCMPIGYYASAGPNTHYKTDLVEFKNKSEIPDYLAQQDKARQRKQIESDLKTLCEKLEGRRGPDRQLTGKLENDAERNIFKTFLASDLFTDAEKEPRQRYYQNDQPMRQWLFMRQPTPKTDFTKPRANSLPTAIRPPLPAHNSFR